MENVLTELYQTVLSRKNEKAEGSYTCYLFEKGLDKILKKCGEECSEVIIAAELERRSQKQGNLKQFHRVDKNT